jgi:glycosyltransferase involved in cell wall biosynthesis
MWILQSLCQEYRVDLLTRGGWDLDDLNLCAGTNIQREDLGIILHPPLTPTINTTGGALWHGVFLRCCRQFAPKYDLCITASRILDWGVPSINFLSDVAWNRALQERFDCPEARPINGLLRKASFALGRWIAGSSGRVPAQYDILVANSQWTAGISSEYCKVPPVVIYPAVSGAAAQIPWNQRENSFLCLGRISPEKQIERAMAILDQVRILGHAIQMHLVGTGDDDAYLGQIKQLCEARREWVLFHVPLYGEDKLKLLARCRYGLNACSREAFGIATAEFMKSGILPFVPQEGAQAEIVQERELIYQDIEDAALKIDALLRSETRQQELHQAMLRRGAEFTPERFCQAVRDLVSRVLDGRKDLR